jgi:lysophospholipase L1-like esterase
MTPFRLLTLALATALGLIALSLATAQDPERTGYPNSMAATGDSITRAFNTCFFPFIDCPNNSWSTGGSSTVQSHYWRILQQNGGISGRNFNDAVSGAKMTNLNSQVSTVNGRNVDYVTILMGANDVCTSSESTMTPVSTFRAQFEQAMQTLTFGSPNAAIYVVTIPDVYILWDILKDNSSARSAWNTYNICQSLLANPLSTHPDDVERRLRVRQRNIDFNIQLEEVCAQYIHCRFDNWASFNVQFVPSDVSTRDYFHPSVQGLTKAAAVTWAETFDFTDNQAPVSTATVTNVSGGISVSITATDNVGVAGIEYKIDGSAYQRYDAPVFVATGSTIEYRAVDVNGNNEASKSITATGDEPTATNTPEPTATNTPEPDPTATNTPEPDPTATSTPEPDPTPTPTPEESCPPGWQRQGRC